MDDNVVPVTGLVSLESSYSIIPVDVSAEYAPTVRYIERDGKLVLQYIAQQGQAPKWRDVSIVENPLDDRDYL